MPGSTRVPGRGSAGLAFDADADDQVVELAAIVADHSAEEVVDQVMGLPPDHPLRPDVVELVAAHQAG